MAATTGGSTVDSRRLRVDLGLVKAVVGPAGAGALTRPSHVR